MSPDPPGHLESGHEADLAEARRAREEYGRDLVTGVMDALPGWVERAVLARLPVDRRADPEIAPLVAEAAAAAVEECRRSLAAAVSREPGIDHGPSPLEVVRTLVRYPTQVLRALGIGEIERSAFDRRAFPDDAYGLSPATWADIDPSLQGPGLAWGAATAHVHKRARRSPGAGSGG